MDGRTTERRMTNRQARAHRVASPDATEPAEMTELLHHLVTEVARVHRGESDGASFPPYSPKEFAAALPTWKRLLDLFIVALLFPLWLPIMTLVALWVAVDGKRLGLVTSPQPTARPKS